VYESWRKGGAGKNKLRLWRGGEVKVKSCVVCKQEKGWLRRKKALPSGFVAQDGLLVPKGTRGVGGVY